jgi:hypothetical protein
MESHFAVRHTPPDEQDPVSTVGAPTQVRFPRFAVRQTAPDEQDPVSTIAGRTEGRFLRTAVRQTPFRLFRPSRLAPDEHDAFRCLPMNTTQFLCSDPAGWLPMNRTPLLPSIASPCTRALAVRMREYAFETLPLCTYVAIFVGMWLYVRVHGLEGTARTATSGALILHVPLLAWPRFKVVERPIDQYVCTCSRQRYIRFDQVGPSCQGG